MKKVLALLATLLFLLAACATQEAEPTSERVMEEFAGEDAGDQMMEKTEVAEKTMDSEMLNLAKALEMGKSVKCTTTFDGQTSTTYWKNERMRMDTPSVDAHGIYTEDVMYTWTGKQGVMMKLDDIKDMAKNAQDQNQAPPKTKEDIMNENVDVTCTPTDVQDSMFVPPSDVEFQDMSEIFKQLEGMNINMPNVPQ